MFFNYVDLSASRDALIAEILNNGLLMTAITRSVSLRIKVRDRNPLSKKTNQLIEPISYCRPVLMAEGILNTAMIVVRCL